MTKRQLSIAMLIEVVNYLSEVGVVVAGKGVVDTSQDPQILLYDSSAMRHRNGIGLIDSSYSTFWLYCNGTGVGIRRFHIGVGVYDLCEHSVSDPNFLELVAGECRRMLPKTGPIDVDWPGRGTLSVR